MRRTVHLVVPRGSRCPLCRHTPNKPWTQILIQATRSLKAAVRLCLKISPCGNLGSLYQRVDIWSQLQGEKIFHCPLCGQEGRGHKWPFLNFAYLENKGSRASWVPGHSLFDSVQTRNDLNLCFTLRIEVSSIDLFSLSVLADLEQLCCLWKALAK